MITLATKHGKCILITSFGLKTNYFDVRLKITTHNWIQTYIYAHYNILCITLNSFVIPS